MSKIIVIVKGKARHGKGAYEEKRIMKAVSKRSFSVEPEMEEKKVPLFYLNRL